MEVEPELKEAFEESIAKAERLDAPTLTAYYQFLDEMVTMIPPNRDLLSKILEFYYLIDQSPEGKLQKDDLFQQWTLQDVVLARKVVPAGKKPDVLLHLTLSEWEKAIGLSPLKENPDKP